MVRFGRNPKNIEVAPAPERKPEPKPKDKTFGGEPTTAPVEPELSETPVIDEVQAEAPPKPQTLKETAEKVAEKPKPKQHKKGKNKHSKKKRRHGR